MRATFQELIGQAIERIRASGAEQFDARGVSAELERMWSERRSRSKQPNAALLPDVNHVANIMRMKRLRYGIRRIGKGEPIGRNGSRPVQWGWLW